MAETKIYVDGFLVDTIMAPQIGDSIRAAALTPKVLELIENRKIRSITPVDPSLILITTQL